MGQYVEEPEFEELKRWAKTADFPEPVQWGEVETVIMAYPAPPRDQLDPRLMNNDRARSLIGYLIMLPEVVVVFGSSVIGLGFVIAHIFYGMTVREDSWVFIFLWFEFFAAIVISVFPVLMWWTTKRRGRLHLPISGGTSVVSFASFWLLWTSPQSGGLSSFTLYALIAAAAGLVTFVFMLVKAEPGIRRPLRERWRTLTPKEKWYRGNRAGVLAELEKRNLVSKSDTSAMLAMPLRTWHELDVTPPQAWVGRGHG